MFELIVHKVQPLKVFDFVPMSLEVVKIRVVHNSLLKLKLYNLYSTS